MAVQHGAGWDQTSLESMYLIRQAVQSIKHCILELFKSRSQAMTRKMCLERSKLGTVNFKSYYEMTCVRNRQPVVDSLSTRTNSDTQAVY